MTLLVERNGFTVLGGQYLGSSPYSFGVSVAGPREHPLEPSTTVAYPFLPVTVLNDAIPVTKSDPSIVGHLEPES
jgi:hypothetical protein